MELVWNERLLYERQQVYDSLELPPCIALEVLEAYESIGPDGWKGKHFRADARISGRHYFIGRSESREECRAMALEWAVDKLKQEKREITAALRSVRKNLGCEVSRK